MKASETRESMKPWMRPHTPGFTLDMASQAWWKSDCPPCPGLHRQTEKHGSRVTEYPRTSGQWGIPSSLASPYRNWPTQAIAPRPRTSKQKHAEYDRQRRQTQGRNEQVRLIAQEHQQKAKELGKCRNCSKTAILGQTRCEPCAEKHRRSGRRSDARLRTTAEDMATTEE